MLTFYSGSSNAVNTATAMRESLDLAFGEGGGADADLLVLHATMGHNFPQLLAAAREACPTARIIGCSGSGVIAHEASVKTCGPLPPWRSPAMRSPCWRSP